MHWISLIAFLLLIGLCHSEGNATTTTATAIPNPVTPIVVFDNATSTVVVIQPVHNATVAVKTIISGGNPLDYARIFPFILGALISLVHL